MTKKPHNIEVTVGYTVRINASTRVVSTEPTASDLVRLAHEYQLGATLLLAERSSVERPVYFLYAHAIELSFKAFLTIQGQTAPWIHKLSELYSQCENHTLKLSVDTVRAIELMAEENDINGFRYLQHNSTIKPELIYLSEAVEELLRIVDAVVEGTLPAKNAPKGILEMTVNKQEPI